MTSLLAFEPSPVLVPVPADVLDSKLSLDELGSRIVGMAGRIAAAMSRWLLLVAEFDRRDGCATSGLPSTARWLSFACGLSHRTAIEHVRVARSLSDHPPLVAAMASGALSYSHARAISRVAHPDEPVLVDDLIELARHATIAQLEDTVRGLRTVEDNENSTEGARIRPAQSLSRSWTSESQWTCHATLDPENGALVHSVVDEIARAEKITPVEALVRMAEIALAAVHDSNSPLRPLRGDERAAVVVHVDAGLIPPGEPVGDEPPSTGPTGRTSQTHQPAARSIERGRPAGRIAGGPGLPTSVILRLMCMGQIRTIVRDGRGSPLDLGRSKRVVSRKQFRALLLRDGGCTHPGCGSHDRLEAHHVRHWLYGGRTDLDNLVLLCCRHHHAHHDGEFTIAVRPDKSFRFLRRDGRELEMHIDPAVLRDAWAPIEQEHDAVAGQAARGRWCGDRLDRAYVVSVLADRRDRIRVRREREPRAAGAE